MLYKDDLISEFGSEGRHRRHLEDDLQAAVCTFLKWALPHNATYWAVPNGGKRHTKEAARMTKTGIKAGIPDVHIAHASRLYCLELKAPRGVLSPTQEQVIEKLGECGVPTAVCRSVEDVEHALKTWRIPVSARLT